MEGSARCRPESERPPRARTVTAEMLDEALD